MKPKSCGGSPGKPNWKRHVGTGIENEHHPIAWHKRLGYPGCEQVLYGEPSYYHLCPGCGDCFSEKDRVVNTAINFIKKLDPSPSALACAEDLMAQNMLSVPVLTAASLIQRALSAKDARIKVLQALLESVVGSIDAPPELNVHKNELIRLPVRWETFCAIRTALTTKEEHAQEG